MKSFDELKKENGGFTLDGKKYVLLQQAYMCDEKHYEATAISPDDQPEPDEAGDYWIFPCYEVKWEIPESTFAYWAEGNDDESDACDWEHPESVREIGGYDMWDEQIV